MKPCLALLLLAASACSRDETAAPNAPRNVVVVLLDSVRADHVGAYGYARSITPHLDALAADGAVFEHAWAASSVAPQSLSALWTGRLPSSGGSTGLREATPHDALVTLPRTFLRAGFRTGLVSNRGGLRERAFTRGFDDLEVDSDPGRWDGELVTAKALELIDQAAEEPLFLLVDYADAAEPHFPREELRARIDVPLPNELLSLPNLRGAAGDLPPGIEDSPGFLDLIARYDAEVAHVDRCLGELVAGLRGRGLLDDTLLVVTSPRGTEFLEHGYVGSGWTLYEEVLRVPLVLHAPGFLSPTRIAEPVSLVDLLPTLRRLYAPGEEDPATDGRALLEPTRAGLALRPPAGEVLAELVVSELCILRAVLRGDCKLIEAVRWVPPEERLATLARYDETVAGMQDGELPRPDPWGAPERSERFDLASDPGETRDLTASEDAQVEALRAALARYAQKCLTTGLLPREPARRAELPAGGEVERLQQLGYL